VSIYRRSVLHLNFIKSDANPASRGNAAIGLKMGFLNHF